MKKLLILALTTLMLAACSDGDKTVVINNSDRVSDLERRMQLNEQLDSMQSALIDSNSQATQALEIRVSALESQLSDLQSQLATEISERQAGDEALQSLIEQEAEAREEGDQEQADALAAAIAQQSANNAAQQANINALNLAIAAQFGTNILVQSQISYILSKISMLTSSVNSLQSQINNTNSSVSNLASQISSVQSSVSTMGSQLSALQGSMSGLQSQISALSSRLDAEGVKIYKCNASSSEERFLKINGKFYGTMNQVTLGSSSVIAASTPVTVTTPKLCVNNGNNFKLPDSNGNCNGSGWSVLANSGITTTIPAYSSSSITVVTSVQISLEELLPGTSYVTTDGTTPCYFNGNGTNLIQVQ